jgi:DNA-binding transcriptional ArsR family regulator
MHTAQQLDDIFTALANPKRREMVYMLSLRPANVTQLAQQTQLSLPAIHKHIRILEQSQLILRKKVGRTNFIALNKQSLLILQEWVMQYHAHWGNNHETLENYIASMDH